MVIVGNLLSMRKGSKGFKEYIIHKLNKLKGNALEFKKTPKNTFSNMYWTTLPVSIIMPLFSKLSN